MVRNIQFSELEQLLLKKGFTKVKTTGSQKDLKKSTSIYLQKL